MPESLPRGASQLHSTFGGEIERPTQLGLPSRVEVREIAREASLGGAIELCAKVGGYELDKALQAELGVDKAQFSRWQAGTEGIIWPKLRRLMDACGNDAPLLWMLHQRGYDLNALRMRETETEQKLRLAHERIAQLETEREVTMRVLKEIKA